MYSYRIPLSESSGISESSKGLLPIGFTRQQNFFIATPEKAFLDAVYLMSFGRYALDLSAIDDEKLNRKEIHRISQNYPPKTRKMLEKHGYLGPA